MAVIDSNNFITHLVWGGLIDKATCGELKEAIELCTVKDIYTKADVVAMLEEVLSETEEMDCEIDHDFEGYYNGVVACQKCIQQKINSLKETEDATDRC